MPVDKLDITVGTGKYAVPVTVYKKDIDGALGIVAEWLTKLVQAQKYLDALPNIAQDAAEDANLADLAGTNLQAGPLPRTKIQC